MGDGHRAYIVSLGELARGLEHFERTELVPPLLETADDLGDQVALNP